LLSQRNYCYGEMNIKDVKGNLMG